MRPYRHVRTAKIEDEPPASSEETPPNASVARSAGLLFGSFLLTFAVLSLGWMVSTGRSAPAPLTSPIPTALVSIAPPTSHPGHKPTKAPPTDQPTDTPAAATPSPVVPATSIASPSLPFASMPFGQTFAISGGAYVASDVPNGATITPAGDGVTLHAPADATNSLLVIYSPDASTMPANSTVATATLRVCGSGSGTFEIAGPMGGSPATYESTAPSADGCWHFSASAPSNLDLTVSALPGGEVHIDLVEYTLTFDH